MTPDLVIFDCDGVLVDTEAATAEILSSNLGRHGLVVSPAEVRELFQGGTMPKVGEAARARGAELPDDWVARIYDEVYDHLGRGVTVIPGVLDLIEDLEARGIATAVVSNGPPRKMEISLGPSGLHDRFAGRIWSAHDQGAAPKPDPSMLLRAVEAAGTTPDRAVMIDDSPAGCAAARAAGMPCFGFAADGNDAALAAEGAQVVRDMAEIRARLLA